MRQTSSCTTTMNAKTGGRRAFSIIIPTFNNPRELEECIKALNTQVSDGMDVETIIVNDGAEMPEFEALARKYGEKNYFYTMPRRKGPAAARNFGLKKACGEIVLFLDDDSLPTNDWLEANASAWAENPDADGIGGRIICGAGESILCKANSDIFNWLMEKGGESHPSFLCTCNAGYRMDALKRMNGFDEGYKFPGGEDRDINDRIAKSGGRLIVDGRITVYHDRDLTFHSFLRKYYNYGKAAKRLHANHPDDTPRPLKEYIRLFSKPLENHGGAIETAIILSAILLSQACTLAGYYLGNFNSKDERKT